MWQNRASPIKRFSCTKTTTSPAQLYSVITRTNKKKREKNCRKKRKEKKKNVLILSVRECVRMSSTRPAIIISTSQQQRMWCRCACIEAQATHNHNGNHHTPEKRDRVECDSNDINEMMSQFGLLLFRANSLTVCR